DRSGHAYVGNFGFALDRKSRPTPTVLVRVNLDRSASVVSDELELENGAVINPAARTLLDGHTLRYRYTTITMPHDSPSTGSRDAVITMTRADVPHAGLP